MNTNYVEKKLPFPLVKVWNENENRFCQEYEIPNEKKKDVLVKLYPFVGCPDLNAELFDIHAGKKFIAIEYKVIRENELNYLVSPYFYESGGTVIDWVLL